VAVEVFLCGVEKFAKVELVLFFVDFGLQCHVDFVCDVGEARLWGLVCLVALEGCAQEMGRRGREGCKEGFEGEGFEVVFVHCGDVVVWSEVACDDFGEVMDDGNGVWGEGYLGSQQTRQQCGAPCVVGDGFGVMGRRMLSVWNDAPPSGTVQVEGLGKWFEVCLDGFGGGVGRREQQALDDACGKVEGILDLY